VQAARKAETVTDPNRFAAERLFGAAVPVHQDGRPSLLDLARSVKKVSNAPAGGPQAAAAFSVAYEAMRVTVYRDHAVAPSAVQPLLDVGRVRWCELSARPVIWWPLNAEDPNMVGGTDRPWTDDLPAASADWRSRSPALRLDPDWHAVITLDPKTGTLCCVAPDGSWWDLQSDFETVVSKRRAHVDSWLEALEAFEEDLPARAEAAASIEPPDAEPERLSRAWILERAERYEYAADDAPRAAGARAARGGHYTYEDFLTVVRWKSARALPRAERNAPQALERQTRLAFDAKDEVQRITALTALDGVGVPVASALLHFAFPDAFPILDFRALESLGDKTRRTHYSPRFWADYVERCRRLAEAAGVSIRDLDKALWQDSRESAGGR
jgi:hypothetical protein